MILLFFRYNCSKIWAVWAPHLYGIIRDYRFKQSIPLRAGLLYVKRASADTPSRIRIGGKRTDDFTSRWNAALAFPRSRGGRLFSWSRHRAFFLFDWKPEGLLSPFSIPCRPSIVPKSLVSLLLCRFSRHIVRFSLPPLPSYLLCWLLSTPCRAPRWIWT